METSTARRRSGREEPATTVTEIPDHLVAEIFLRLPATEDLARASARRRQILPPPLPPPPRPAPPRLFGPRRVPPRPPATPFSADFSLSFFPNHSQWAVADIRDPLVLVLRIADGIPFVQLLSELAVCDPLHRKYVLLPPVPYDLDSSVVHPDSVHKAWCETFLVPLDEEAETAFSVIWMAHFATRLAAFVYSSTTGQWHASESAMVSPIDRNFHERHYAYGCFYWESTMMEKKELLVLDTRTMEFSISDLPPRDWSMLGLAIVEAGEGRLGLFGIPDGTLDSGKFDLCYYIRGKKRESSSQWQLEKTISLGQHHIKTASGGYLLLGKFGATRFVDSSTQMAELEYISVDVKMLQLERVCSKSSGFGMSKTWIYTNFPPSFSSPTI